MDKNPDIDGFKLFSTHISKNTITSLLCPDSFSKAFVLKNLAEFAGMPIHYLDFDLLYSGYIGSGMFSLPPNVMLKMPDADTLLETWKNVVDGISKRKYLVIVDSLNGFFNCYDKLESGRLVNSYMMFLASIAKTSQSPVIAASVSKYKKDEGWTLSPTARQVIKHKEIVDCVIKNENGLEAEISKDGQNLKVNLQK